MIAVPRTPSLPASTQPAARGRRANALVLALSPRVLAIVSSLRYIAVVSKSKQQEAEDATGLTNARARLAIKLAGTPAMDAAGFAALRAKPRTNIGA